jgi:electron transfer DM13
VTLMAAATIAWVAVRIVDRVVETFPLAAGAPPAVARSQPAPAPAPAPAGPVRLRSGMFSGIDHRASGAVNIYAGPDGHVVGLEDFDIQPGPDYDLYVVPGSGRKDRTDGVRLDDLRGNQGTQFYAAPAGADLGNGPWTVLVWCQTFGVPVAHATPA